MTVELPGRMPTGPVGADIGETFMDLFLKSPWESEFCRPIRGPRECDQRQEGGATVGARHRMRRARFWIQVLAAPATSSPMPSRQAQLHGLA